MLDSYFIFYCGLIEPAELNKISLKSVFKKRGCRKQFEWWCISPHQSKKIMVQYSSGKWKVLLLKERRDTSVAIEAACWDRAHWQKAVRSHSPLTVNCLRILNSIVSSFIEEIPIQIFPKRYINLRELNFIVTWSLVWVYIAETQHLQSSQITSIFS